MKSQAHLAMPAHAEVRRDHVGDLGEALCAVAVLAIQDRPGTQRQVRLVSSQDLRGSALRVTLKVPGAMFVSGTTGDSRKRRLTIDVALCSNKRAHDPPRDGKSVPRVVGEPPTARSVLDEGKHGCGERGPRVIGEEAIAPLLF